MSVTTPSTGSATAPPSGTHGAVRIGVMGCADFAFRRMLPAFAACRATEIAAVASRDPRKAARLAARYDCRPVHGYEHLLALDDVQAVYVPLPVALHAPWVEAALRAGKHVLAEKPLTTDPRQTEHLLTLARDRGLALMENVLFVHHPGHTRVRELLDSGLIGQLRAFHGAFTTPPRPATDIRYAPELGGGALWDVGVHPLRAALHFLGPGLRVVGACLGQGPGRTVDTSGAALLRTDTGVAAHITFGMEHAYRSAYELWGSEGRITVDRAFTPPPDHGPVVTVHRDGGSEDVSLEPCDQAVRAVAAFARAVAAGGAPGEGTAVQARLAEAVRVAAGYGRGGMAVAEAVGTRAGATGERAARPSVMSG
ncbi:Gfo/Idh/MocA family oxidoreductase [Streptomyces sp. NA04227]|uniref:Gfo/Idh/MocA family protein n=1 Tax=Streptomyces sp. NA04227 TaxID=2742136 RepID=UPI001591E413|nr:Gfo/Idh/MocA family oxidoreductase [Streptomyces sp. NA04227]QKW08079.1 Gfo/Idh/MocA family oxidoreductase [Streptomyces sp. NA04227]